MKFCLLVVAGMMAAGTARAAGTDDMGALKNILGLGKSPKPSSDSYCYGFNAGPYDSSRFIDVKTFMENGQKMVLGPAKTTMEHYSQALAATQKILGDFDLAEAQKVHKASKSWEAIMNGPELTKAFFSMARGAWGSLSSLVHKGLNVPEELTCHSFMLMLEKHPVLNAKSGATQDARNAVLRSPEFVQESVALFQNDLNCVKQDAQVIMTDMSGGDAFTSNDMTPRDRATTLFAFAYDSGKLMRDIRMLICSGVHVGKMIADANNGEPSSAALRKLVERLVNELEA